MGRLGLTHPGIPGSEGHMTNRIRAAVAELKSALQEAGIEGCGIRLFDLDDGEMLRYVMGEIAVFAIPPVAAQPAAFGTSIAGVGVMWVNERKQRAPIPHDRSDRKPRASR